MSGRRHRYLLATYRRAEAASDVGYFRDVGSTSDVRLKLWYNSRSTSSLRLAIFTKTSETKSNTCERRWGNFSVQQNTSDVWLKYPYILCEGVNRIWNYLNVNIKLDGSLETGSFLFQSTPTVYIPMVCSNWGTRKRLHRKFETCYICKLISRLTITEWRPTIGGWVQFSFNMPIYSLLSSLKIIQPTFHFTPKLIGPVRSCAILTTRRAYSPEAMSAHWTNRLPSLSISDLIVHCLWYKLSWVNQDPPSKQNKTIVAYNINAMLANVEDVGPALYNCYTNVLCLLGSV